MSKAEAETARVETICALLYVLPMMLFSTMFVLWLST